MNKKISEHVAKVCEAAGYEASEENIIEEIRDGKRIWRGNESGRRWWTDCFTVVSVDGMLIGFDDAITTGDDTPSDKGWEFDPESICEVESEDITTTVYRPKK